MSTFTVEKRTLIITPIANADALELAQIDGTGYVAVVGKGQFQTGSAAVYIPEAAIVPDNLITQMGLEDKLAGGTVNEDGSKKKNRVKAVRLRGQLSQGLVLDYADIDALEYGIDYAELLDISKYVPPIPIDLAGQVEHNPGILTYTSIENIKNFPDVLVPGEPIIATEKLHGSCTCLALIDGEFVVSSKGQAGKQLIIKETDGNAYWKMARTYGIEEKLRLIADRYDTDRVHLYGETVGVQDLRYGLPKGQLAFMAFDLRIGYDTFVSYDEFLPLLAELDIPGPTVLYEGPFDLDTVLDVTSGKEQFTGDETHIREGVVLRPATERRDDNVGRVILKSISGDYLTRKGDATEYE